MQQQRRLWMEGRFCDVTIKSRDGAEHPAHAGVLCAASSFFDSLFGGSFLEADQMQHGGPVEIDASDAAVFALLDYIYGGEPEVPVEDSIELLRLADAYHLPNLAAATEARLRASLDSQENLADIALKLLQHSQGLHSLKAACEEKVALNFAACVQHPDFVKLSAGHLGRILESLDLTVKREEEVLKALLHWANGSANVGDVALLLRHVDFRAISFENLSRIGRFASSMGQHGDALQREVGDALRGKKRNTTDLKIDASWRPKRRCFHSWSGALGASCQGSWRKVLPKFCTSLCWHEGALYADHFDTVICWKPGDLEPRIVAGRGARVTGVNDLGRSLRVSVSSEGAIVVGQRVIDERLVRFQDGSGQLVAAESLASLEDVFYSPNGAIYVLQHTGTAVHKLVGTKLEPVVTWKDLAENFHFFAQCLHVTGEEVVYLADGNRVLRIKPGETTPVIVGEVAEEANFVGLFVTKCGQIYVADHSCRKVWVFNPGDACGIEVLEAPENLTPVAVLVQDQSLYVCMCCGEARFSVNVDVLRASESKGAGVYEYALPPEISLA
eukprot:Skav231680  [mRNA]  locus=scaffold597:568402:570075:+ [translate_table: standard]